MSNFTSWIAIQCWMFYSTNLFLVRVLKVGHISTFLLLKVCNSIVLNSKPFAVITEAISFAFIILNIWVGKWIIKKTLGTLYKYWVSQPVEPRKMGHLTGVIKKRFTKNTKKNGFVFLFGFLFGRLDLTQTLQITKVFETIKKLYFQNYSWSQSREYMALVINS